MEIKLSSRFKKKAKKLSAKERKLLEEKLDMFVENPADPRLKVHQLAGRMKGRYAFSLTFGKRVVFLFVEPGTALMFDVGSHDEVYR